MPPDAPPPTVTVWGEAAVRTEPDEAVLSLTLSAVEKSPGAALSDVAERGATLVQRRTSSPPASTDCAG